MPHLHGESTQEFEVLVGHVLNWRKEAEPVISPRLCDILHGVCARALELPREGQRRRSAGKGSPLFCTKLRELSRHSSIADLNLS
jgi:hypothetical protein